MSRSIFAALSLTTLLMAGCSTDSLAPEATGTSLGEPPGGPSAVVNAADTAAVLGSIRLLMTDLTPNDQSVASKFVNLVAVLDDPARTAEVVGAIESVIDKILLEYDKYVTPPKNGDPDRCLVAGPTGGCAYTVETLKDKVIADIYAYAGLSGNICKVSPTDPTATLCEAPAKDAFVYFPPGIAAQLTYVSIQNVVTPLNSGFDEYPVNVKIKTAPITSFPDPANRPIVVTCFAPGISAGASERALLGHRHENADGTAGYFKLLTPAALTPELEAQALSYCGNPLAPSAAIFGLSTERGVGRLLSRAVEALLPARLQAAAAMFRGFAGASGSPEEFSTFGAVDPGLLRGGASGSPEEFAPPVGGAPMAAAYDPPTSTTSGAAGESTTTGLPYVEVTTELGAPVAGVAVTFSLQATTQVQYGPASNPAFCGAPSPASVVVTTGTDGRATLTCLNFGTVAGFADLKATLDPSGVDPLACMVTAAGGCATSDEAHFLVRTEPGPAATIEKVAGDNQTAAAYSTVPVPPQIRVTDQYGNGVPGASIQWSANLGSIVPSLGATTPGDGQTTTGSLGTSALTAWTLGVGDNTLLAETVIGSGVSSVTFAATGTFTLGLANACVTGGAKDDITAYGFSFPNERNKVIQAVGVNLSSNGAPGASENYEVTLRAERNPGEVRTAKGRLQSSSNSSKGVESLVIFDFGANPFPALGGNQPAIAVTLSTVQIVNGQVEPMPTNRKINMNVGGCSAGAKNCKPVEVSGAGKCDITESQLNPFVASYRRGFAGRIYTIN